jgi:putative nucleotidyltransferase with HDIG domain
MVISMLLPIFEYAFGLTTTISLLELSDLDHPLLKRLQVEAPGTYYHSLVVATLAERAAAAIGADTLLARVCAYFHDIGKLAHPEYFTENNQGHNPHESLEPRMSSLIILNHVKEGLDLAIACKLKRPLREAISQHHGTSLVYYFYHRAKTRVELESGPGTKKIGEYDYRYPGPRPRRKEIALIGIADACEAAVRALEKPTHRKIHALVDEIIVNRIKDHQFDEANLTFAELAKARDALVMTLGMMYHERVRYPKEMQKLHETDLVKTAMPAAVRSEAEVVEAAEKGNESDRPE